MSYEKDISFTFDFFDVSSFKQRGGNKRKKGWNLLGMSQDLISTECILKELGNESILWKYDNINKKWSAYSKQSSINNLLLEKGFSIANNVNLNEGFWIYTKNDKTVTLNCSETNQSNQTLNRFFPSGLAVISPTAHKNAVSSSRRLHVLNAFSDYETIVNNLNSVAQGTTSPSNIFEASLLDHMPQNCVCFWTVRRSEKCIIQMS